jgi:hypothetical protein
MRKDCELLEKCGFFKKYQTTKNLASKGLIEQYCEGPHMDKCKRKEYREEHGSAPSDDMMPSGKIVTK